MLTKSQSLSPFRPYQLDLLRRTIAADCNRDEFDLFIEAAQQHGLDPFRRQILPIILNKHDRAARRMVTIVSVDGQRIIAQRCGNYRAASEPTKFTYAGRKKGPTNPLEIVLAQVKLWQQDNRGDWHPIVGEAHWDEFVPLKDVWEEDPDTGRIRKANQQILDSKGPWARMPRLMIAKCATMQALRSGWPDKFGGIYAEEELDRVRAAETSASEAIERVQEERRLIAIAGKDAITVSWGDWSLENVPAGQFADRALAWFEESGRTPEEIASWAEANREPLRLFWAKCPADALALKKVIESRSGSLHRNGQSHVPLTSSLGER